MRYLLSILSLFIILPIHAQLSDLIKSQKSKEITLLEQGTLLIPLWNDFDSKENLALRNAFDQEYKFSTYLYFDGDGMRRANDIPAELYDSSMNKIEVILEPKTVFVLDIYYEDFGLKSDSRLIKIDSPVEMETLKKPRQRSEFDAVLYSFNPMNTSFGGMVIEKKEPLMTAVTRKKILITNHSFFARFYKEWTLEQNFSKAVEYLQLQMEERKLALTTID